MAIDEVGRDPADKHDPKLIAEMRKELDLSVEEIPSPEGVSFGNGGRSEEEQEKARVVAREKWRLRKSAAESLSLVLTPAGPLAAGGAEAAKGARVVLRVVNSATGTFFMDRRSIASGLVLRLLDSKGAEVPLNEKGRAMKEYQHIDFHLRAAPITPKYSPRFELNLPEYCHLAPGESYTVHAEWMLEVHDSMFPPDKLNESSKHRITLKSGPVEVNLPSTK